MPYTGMRTDHFDARCRASREDRRLLKVTDLLRLGPYRSESWHRDVVIYSELQLHRFKGRPAAVANLASAFRQIEFWPTPLGLIGVRLQLRLPETQRHLKQAICRAMLLRVNYYLATAGDEQATELVIQKCLNLAVKAPSPEARTDYIRAALGWAAHLKRHDWPEYSRRSQIDIWMAGDGMHFDAHLVMNAKYGGHHGKD
jgi:hypothetical protein